MKTLENTSLLQAKFSLARIAKLLGNAVLIPLNPMTKKPKQGRWQTLTLEAMSDPEHLRLLQPPNNIGVLLGRASNDLCTIDCDTDEFMEEFMALNPILSSTTSTCRVRGCNFWVRIVGDYPPNAGLRSGGKKCGEWRADGNQTVICGQAVDFKKGEAEPTAYRFLNDSPPIQIRFDALVFPDGCFTKPLPRANSSSPSSSSCILHPASYIPTSLHNSTVLENIKRRAESQRILAAKHPGLARLYEDFIEARFEAKAGERNSFLCQVVPFLYRAVAPQFVLEIVMHFYDVNCQLFSDSREQHIASAECLLNGVADSYRTSLGDTEGEVYDALTDLYRTAFRICRDLALLDLPGFPPPTFFMSCDQLGDRLGLYPTQAQRILQRFVSYGLIQILKAGTRRAAGVRGKAATYRWELPTESESLV